MIRGIRASREISIINLFISSVCIYILHYGMKNGWDFDNAIVVLTLDSHKILRLRILNTQILSFRNYILVFNDIIQVINAYISTRFLWDTNILFLDISR